MVRFVELMEPEMVPIKGGTFWMGSPKSEDGRWENERRHRVSIEDFAIGKYTVTFEEYDLFCEATGRDKPEDNDWGRGRHPVINITWHDAVAYAKWLSKETGKRYRLPTEAQWEYAARAGTETAYWWGDSIGENRANCDGCGSQWDDKQTAPVGSFPANPWGLHDTAGNVWEWTCATYRGDYDDSEEQCADESDGDLRVIRGGSWGNRPQRMRSATRFGGLPAHRHNYVGFRLAQD